MGVSSIPFDDRRLFSTFSGLVVSARFARVGNWQLQFAQVGDPTCHPSPQNAALSSELKRRPWLEPHLPFPLPEMLISPAEVIARCRLRSGDCGLLASEKPLTLVVVEAGGRLRLSRIVRDVERPYVTTKLYAASQCLRMTPKSLVSVRN